MGKIEIIKANINKKSNHTVVMTLGARLITVKSWSIFISWGDNWGTYCGCSPPFLTMPFDTPPSLIAVETAELSLGVSLSRLDTGGVISLWYFGDCWDTAFWKTRWYSGNLSLLKTNKCSFFYTDNPKIVQTKKNHQVCTWQDIHEVFRIMPPWVLESKGKSNYNYATKEFHADLKNISLIWLFMMGGNSAEPRAEGVSKP